MLQPCGLFQTPRGERRSQNITPGEFFERRAMTEGVPKKQPPPSYLFLLQNLLQTFKSSQNFSPNSKLFSRAPELPPNFRVFFRTSESLSSSEIFSELQNLLRNLKTFSELSKLLLSLLPPCPASSLSLRLLPALSLSGLALFFPLLSVCPALYLSPNFRVFL